MKKCPMKQIRCDNDKSSMTSLPSAEAACLDGKVDCNPIPEISNGFPSTKPGNHASAKSQCKRIMEVGKLSPVSNNGKGSSLKDTQETKNSPGGSLKVACGTGAGKISQLQLQSQDSDVGSKRKGTVLKRSQSHKTLTENLLSSGKNDEATASASEVKPREMNYILYNSNKTSIPSIQTAVKGGGSSSNLKSDHSARVAGMGCSNRESSVADITGDSKLGTYLSPVSSTYLLS